MKTQTKPQTKPQTTQAPKKALLLNISHVAACPALVGQFYGNGIKYHVKAGRITIDKAGNIHLTAEGRKHFSARPLVDAARKAQAGGGKLEGAEYIAANDWPHPYRLADKYHVAGRKDSQAAFAAVLIG